MDNWILALFGGLVAGVVLQLWWPLPTERSDFRKCLEAQYGQATTAGPASIIFACRELAKAQPGAPYVGALPE